MNDRKNVKLTQAQIDYLINLNERHQSTLAALQSVQAQEQNARQLVLDYIGVLRTDHDAPEAEYELSDINQGFTLIE